MFVQPKLKGSVSEFLYQICGDCTYFLSSLSVCLSLVLTCSCFDGVCFVGCCAADEFIRLVGFGNAAGTLADKGFPGLQALKGQAIDLDELVKKGKNPKS